MITKYARGMVYWVSLPKNYEENIQSGRRPCVIVSNNIGNNCSEIVTVVPCTTNTDKIDSQPTHYAVNLFPSTKSVILCENCITIPKKLCDNFIGILDDKEMEHINECLAIALGIKESPKPVVSTEVLEEVRKTEEKVKETKETKDKDFRKIKDDFKKQYIQDYYKYGVKYCVDKYNIPSADAAYHRRIYYERSLTNKK